MNEVSRLIPTTSQPDESVIARLESALKEAKAGRLREVVIMGTHEGSNYFYNASFSNGPLLLGYVTMIQHQIVHTMQEGESIVI